MASSSLRLGKAAKRALRFAPGAGPGTPLHALGGPSPGYIAAGFTRGLLRPACRLFGGKEALGFSPEGIGSKSTRPGAAMAFFLSSHTATRTMCLGRWKPAAFLALTRPQALGWAESFSPGLAKHEHFAGLGFREPSRAEKAPARSSAKSRLTSPFSTGF